MTLRTLAILTLALITSSCSLLGTRNIEVVSKPIEIEIIQPVLPRPLDLTAPKWFVVSEAKIANNCKKIMVDGKEKRPKSCAYEDTEHPDWPTDYTYLDQFLDHELNRSMRYQHTMSVLLIDIDLFKSVNDTYGHLVGDICIKEVANRFSHQLRVPTDISARYGGEEFCVVLPETSIEGAMIVAERIRKRVGDNPLYLSIDIDVLDPAFAPGTGTPEIAGMTTREMVNVLRGLSGLNLVSADVVEVSPAYDHAEVTSLAAATIVYELTNLFAKS